MLYRAESCEEFVTDYYVYIVWTVSWCIYIRVKLFTDLIDWCLTQIVFDVQ